ncbi:hypothetical protein FOMA001_g10682 [Fusarium oxysporum f. sp. matthiolae]|nr:hypothetical protein FOMA001_g10682 [Fusarium oxysporum f. sp. matthiolae]
MRRAPGLGRLLQRHLEYNRRARRAGLLQLLGPQFKVPPPAQAQAQQRHERERAPPRSQSIKVMMQNVKANADVGRIALGLKHDKTEPLRKGRLYR